MGAGASGQAHVAVPQQPAAWHSQHGYDMPAETRNGVGYRGYDRQWRDVNDWMPSESSSGQRVTHPDVLTSPTSSEFARQHNHETDAVATSGGQYPDALTSLGRNVSMQRNEVYPDLTSGGQDANDTDAENVQDLKVNLPPDGNDAFAICDTSKDDIITKIWSAEEYLGQLDEGDMRIKTLSAAVEKEMHLPRIKELLAIRGHLQDELLRIHDMIVVADSDLSGLEDFVATNSRIVQKLWDLNKNARDIADGRPIADDSAVLPDLCIGTTTTGGTQAVFSKDSATSTSASPQWHCAVSCDLGTDTSDLGVNDKVDGVGQLSESDLKKKHDEEEANVVTRYAHEIVSLEPLNEDIDHILHAHLLSMQALRDKQTREKEQIRQSLAQKRERLLRRSQCSQVKNMEGQGHDASRIHGYSRGHVVQGIDELYPRLHIDGEEQGGHNVSRSAGKERGLGEHVSRSPGKTRRGHDEHVSRSSGKADDVFRSSVDEMKLRLENGMNENREHGFGRRNGEKWRDVDHTGVEVWMNGDMLPDADTAPADSGDMKRSDVQDLEEAEDWAKQSSEQCCGVDDNDMKENSRMQMEDFDGSEEDITVHDHDKDKPDHLDDLPTKSINITETDTGSRSAEKQVTTEKDESFVCQLARERERLSDDDFANLLSKHLSDTECLRRLQNAEKQRLNDKMKAKLTDRENSSFQENSEPEEDAVTSKEMSKLEIKLQRKLLLKRDELDETDIQDIFKKFRIKQQKILKRKEAEKEQSKEMLKQKLERIRRQKIVKKSEIVTEDKEKEDELIEERTRKYRSAVKHMEDSSVRESASSLVHEHQEDMRHINDLRKRERELMDERLKSRLNKKRL